MTEPTENPRAVPGDNNPPEPTPVVPPMPVAPDLVLLEAAIRGENAKFLADANLWIESVARAPAVIENEQQAAAFANTISNLIKARTGAEKIHAATKAPWFKITKAIDAIFLTGVKARAEAAEAIMVSRQKVWIGKVRAAAIAEENRKAREAEEKAQALRDEEAANMRAAERAMDQGNMDEAQDLMAGAAVASEQAQEAEQTAAVAEARAEGKPADLVRQHHASGVTTSAKGFWNVELLPIDKLEPGDLVKYWTALAPYIGADVRLKAAKAAVKAGLREAPGLKIFEDFTPINRG